MSVFGNASATSPMSQFVTRVAGQNSSAPNMSVAPSSSIQNSSGNTLPTNPFAAPPSGGISGLLANFFGNKSSVTGANPGTSAPSSAPAAAPNFNASNGYGTINPADTTKTQSGGDSNLSSSAGAPVITPPVPTSTPTPTPTPTTPTPGSYQDYMSKELDALNNYQGLEQNVLGQESDAYNQGATNFGMTGDVGNIERNSGLELNASANALNATTTAASLAAPQPYSPTTIPYSPSTGTFGPIAANGATPGPNGGTGGVAAGQIEGQINAGANSVPIAQAIGKAQPVAANLDTLVSTNGINPTDITYANGAINFLKSNFGTPAQQAAITEFNGQVNDLASTLAPALGVPGGATTDFKAQLGQSIVNGLQNGQSVQQAIQYFIQQAGQGAAGSLAAAGNPNGTINSAATGSTASAGGYNFQLVNGKWVPAS